MGREIAIFFVAVALLLGLVAFALCQPVRPGNFIIHTAGINIPCVSYYLRGRNLDHIEYTTADGRTGAVFGTFTVEEVKP